MDGYSHTQKSPLCLLVYGTDLVLFVGASLHHDGYKPRGNYQSLLAQEVEAFLDKNPTFMEELAGAPTINPDKAPAPDVLDLDKIIEDPPAQITGQMPSKPWLSRKGRKIDFAQCDALNRQLGKVGEEFVVHLERHRLVSAGRDDLSRKVQWIALEIGDGLGFDVLSLDKPGRIGEAD